MRQEEEEEELVWLCTVSSLRNNIWVSGVVELSVHSNNIWYHCFTVLIHSHFIGGGGVFDGGNVFNIGCRLRADAAARARRRRRRRGGLSRLHKESPFITKNGCVITEGAASGVGTRTAIGGPPQGGGGGQPLGSPPI